MTFCCTEINKHEFIIKLAYLYHDSNPNVTCVLTYIELYSQHYDCMKLIYNFYVVFYLHHSILFIT